MDDCKAFFPAADEELERYFEAAWRLSQDVANHPELGNQEFETSKRMAGFLSDAGFTVEYPFDRLPTAFRGSIGDSGPLVALLVEEDALPGLGHACGHALHGAMSLLAGVSLKPLAEQLGVRLWVVGTPAEETNGAKVVMAKDGIFDGCDLAMMTHCGTGLTTVGYRCLAMDALEFTFLGKSAHASGCPWEGHSALAGVQLFGTAIDSLRQFVRPEIRMHGIITDGGEAPNIVPEHAACKYYFRAPTRKMLDVLLQRIHDCASGAALASGTTVSWKNVEFSFDDMVPAPSAEAELCQICEGLGITYRPEGQPSGSSDMGNVSHCCPALQPIIALTTESIPTHSRGFAQLIRGPKAPAGLRQGARMLARMALKVWTDEKLRRAMHRDFEAAVKAKA